MAKMPRRIIGYTCLYLAIHYLNLVIVFSFTILSFQLILTPSESTIKTRLWMAENGEYLKVCLEA